MEIATASTAAMSAMLLPGSKVVTTMTKKELRNEKMYQITMHLVRKMLVEGLISKEEFQRMEAIFQKKYRPVFGAIFSNI